MLNNLSHSLPYLRYLQVCILTVDRNARGKFRYQVIDTVHDREYVSGYRYQTQASAAAAGNAIRARLYEELRHVE